MDDRQAQDGTDADKIPAAPERVPETATNRVLTPQARRALQEAAARRAAREELFIANEDGGRKGPEPTRFGDWENNGRATDF